MTWGRAVTIFLIVGVASLAGGWLQNVVSGRVNLLGQTPPFQRFAGYHAKELAGY